MSRTPQLSTTVSCLWGCALPPPRLSGYAELVPGLALDLWPRSKGAKCLPGGRMCARAGQASPLPDGFRFALKLQGSEIWSQDLFSVFSIIEDQGASVYVDETSSYSPCLKPRKFKIFINSFTTKAILCKHK